MKEFHSSIWAYYPVANHFVCITTNGTVRKDGLAIMGRGNAKQATQVIPNVRRLLGSYIKTSGNEAGYLEVDEFLNRIVIFPVKKNWWEMADLLLIEQGAKWLRNEAVEHPEAIFHLPRPGCGNGSRDWLGEVKPLCVDLPDNVWIHCLEK